MSLKKKLEEEIFLNETSGVLCARAKSGHHRRGGLVGVDSANLGEAASPTSSLEKVGFRRSTPIIFSLTEQGL